MRIHNFCAGPCTLPLDVLEEVQSELLDFEGSGMSDLGPFGQYALYPGDGPSGGQSCRLVDWKDS